VALQWFYEIAGKQAGPVSSAELLALAQRGVIVHDTPVRKGPDGKWVSARRVRGLFPAPNATSPSTPTVTSEPTQDQPAEAIPQKPSQPLASDVYIVSATPPSEEPSQFTAVGNIDAICPYCGNRLEKKPGRKKKCPHCGNFIHVRTRPLDNKKVFVTEKQMEAINEQWGIVHPQSTIGQTVAAERANFLSSRTFTDWEGITEAMDAKLRDILTDGVSHGRHPREVARTITTELGIDSERAFTIAHTEIARCHSDGQLDEMEDMGVTKLGAAVEWLTAGDDRVCEMCAPLNGIVLTTKEACGLLPRHDECRCCWTPANVGEDTKGQKRTKEEIEEAIDKSVKVEIRELSNSAPAEQEVSSNWRGATLTIAETRPKGIF
jgi:SPP1 gp7 family putative phage head morphogenesis protein